jgi:hypothetical protein
MYSVTKGRSEVGRGLGAAQTRRSRLRLRAETSPRMGWIGQLETTLGQVEDLALLGERLSFGFVSAEFFSHS